MNFTCIQFQLQGQWYSGSDINISHSLFLDMILSFITKYNNSTKNAMKAFKMSLSIKEQERRILHLHWSIIWLSELNYLGVILHPEYRW